MSSTCLSLRHLNSPEGEQDYPAEQVMVGNGHYLAEEIDRAIAVAVLDEMGDFRIDDGEGKSSYLPSLLLHGIQYGSRSALFGQGTVALLPH